jgi:hypothetical protein
MSAFVAAGGGFLLAVLWFDLMFDVQTLGRRHGELPEPVLVSVASYYRRVTTGARPMNRLIAAVMVATLAAIIVEIAREQRPVWAAWASLALAVGPILLAVTNTVPRAVRLGARTDPLSRQSVLARSICRDHLLCVMSIAALLALQLAAA